MRLWLLLLTLVAAPLWAQGEDFYIEGAQYQAINPPAPTNVPEGKVEVVELFWYGCPHCYHFEPTLDAWLEHMPAQAEFRRIPAVLNPHWTLHARAFYTAELLGVLDKVHIPLFKAIHEQGKRLSSEDSLAKFFAKYGVPEDKFHETFNSFEVHIKLREAAQLGQAYQAGGVPAMIVAGKYLVSASMAGGYPEMIQVVNHLIERESGVAQAKP